MSKKQFESSGDIVLPSLRGLVRSSPWLTLIPSEKVVFRKSSHAKVTLLSGGGSGHEPTHAGFVGTGLLDCAVAGSVFASPSTKQIYAGLKAVDSEKGTLVIVKNYTGDVIHFGLASERAKSQGAKVEVVVVGDDVSVGREQGGLVGRRALAGTVLVHKIAGAAAESGLELEDVANIARSVISNTATIAASLDHCNVPGRAFESGLKNDEIEIGMGIHNEPGVKKASPIPSIPDLVNQLLPPLLSQTDKDRSFVSFAGSDDVVLMINNLGGLSNLELLYAAEVVTEQLKETFKISPVRTLIGAYITALNGPGFSITLLNVSKASSTSNADLLKLFDAPANASGWNQGTATTQWDAFNKLDGLPEVDGPETAARSTEKSTVRADPQLYAKVLEEGVKSVLREERKITEYDTVAGDGDCGETLAAGGNAILNAIQNKTLRLDDGVNSISDIAEVVEDSMGGTSGGLYSIYLHALAKGVQISGQSTLNEKTFAAASQYALESLYKYTKARIGSRTVIDTLAPLVQSLNRGESFAKAVEAAVNGAESTRKLEAKLGRASYVAKEDLKNFDSEGGLPDPGAIGLSALLQGFLAAM